MKIADPTLDQVRIFLAVVETGSFGAAARKMGRAISAISYGIAQMEQQLGIVLFDREGSRRPVLTASGKGVLAEARAIADHTDALLAKTTGIHEGLETEIGLVVDVMVPGSVTAAALKDLQSEFPTVSLRLFVEGLGAVAMRLHDGTAGIAIGGPVIGAQPDLERRAIGSVDLVPVAAPTHPLAKDNIQPGESRRHLQLVLSDRSLLTQGQEFSVLSANTWRLGDLSAKHDLLRQGIGWGNMPLPMIAPDIASGALVRLNLPERPEAQYPFAALWRRDTVPGIAASRLIAAFEERLVCSVMG